MMIGRARLEFERNAAMATLDRVPVGVILVNSSGLVLTTNHMAREILKPGDPLRLRENKLSCRDSKDSAALSAAINTALANDCSPAESGEEVLALGRRHGRPLPVLVFPQDVREEFNERAKRTAVLFFRDPDQNPIRTESRWLEKLFSVTPTEARLAARLGNGLSLEDAAGDLGISTNTARVHLRHIFTKTGTNRQAELVRLILSGPALAPLS